MASYECGHAGNRRSRQTRSTGPLRLALTLLVFLCAHAAVAQTPKPDPRQGDGGVSAFYTWEKAIPASPGVLLRREPANLGPTDAVDAFRILYSSTDGVGGKVPVAVSGAVVLPKGTPPKGGWPVVAWDHGTVGVADVAAPSWHGLFRQKDDFLNQWLAAGFAIVATDYQGLGVPGPHPYLNVRPEAYSTLDAVRAALKSFPSLANKILIVGYSQGAGAAFATAGFAPRYAPDLHVVGTVIGGVPYATAQTRKDAGAYSDPNKFSPVVAYMLLTALMAEQTHPELKATDIFTDKAAPFLDKIGQMSLPEAFDATRAAGLTWGNSFKPGGLERLTGMTAKLVEFPTLKIAHPVFVGIGEADQTAVPAVQLLFVKDACAAGTIVEAHRYAGLDHGPAAGRLVKDAIPFAERLLAGASISPICDPQVE